MKRNVYSTIVCFVLLLFSTKAVAQLNADFSSNITSGCTPILVQFSDISTGNPVSWSWNLGNGTTSTLQNPSTTYFNSGTYNISLTVTDANNNTSTKTMNAFITAVATPTVNFTASDTIPQCAPKTIQFTDMSSLGVSGAATYFWDFGDGNTSTSQNPTHTYTSVGNYSVTLQVINSAGCTKIVTKTNYINIVNKPAANFTTPISGSCTTPFVVNFNNTTTGATSYFWSFGNGNTSVATNPSATYTATGSYNVTLIASNGSCKDTMTKNAFVNIGSLNASFQQSATTVCTGNPVNFTNTSQPGVGNSNWSFGDGGTSTNTNPSHAYATAGSYTVRLIENFNNCTDTSYGTVTVNQGPIVQFTANNQMSCNTPFTVSFTNNTVGATSYVWDFGDGTPPSSVASPSHTYTSFGNYTVTLVATSANGCKDTLTIPNYISVYQPSLSISANPPSGCVPAAISFTASINPNVTITSYSWNFGDGSANGTTANPSHTYTAAGTYTVTLNYTVIHGCSYTSTPITVTVGNPPTASFSAAPDSICPRDTVTFTNTSTGPPGTIYTWYFGDGGSLQSNASPVTHVYNARGLYSPFLVASHGGCNDTLLLTNYIYVKHPAANFIASYSCTNKLQVTFTDLSTGSTPTSLTWYWDFGDNTTATQQNPIHLYPSYGSYTATLIVTDTVTHCTSDDDLNIVLFDVTPDFTADDTAVCRNVPVQFTAQLSTSDASRVTSYDWFFGDGGSNLNSGANATHTYTNNGNYTVTLITTDIRGCKDTIIKQQYISVTGPTANFIGSPLTGCVPLTVSFTNQSSANGGTISSRLWRFGDGTPTSAANNPSHNYFSRGLYNVTLVVTDNNGCKDSLVRNNYINAVKPIASFTSPDSFICPGNSATFTNTSQGTNLTYVWNFGDGSPTSTATSPTHTYPNAGVYTVRLIATEGTNCRDTATMTINVTGMNLGFTASDTFANCPPLTVSFNNTSTGTGAVTWVFGNGNTSSLQNPSTIYTVPGVYTVKLIAQNGTGCKDSITKTITVLGPTGTVSYAPINGCVPLTVTLHSQAQNTQNYVWDMDNGFTQTTIVDSFVYTYTQPGIYVPRVILRDNSNCQVPIPGPDTIVVEQVVADFTFSPSNVCQSGNVQFYDTVLFSYKPITTRQWNFGDGGTSTIKNPIHFYNAPGTYNVTLIIGSNQGCKDTITKTVTILSAPTVNAGADQKLCQNQTLSVGLQATGAANYSWSPGATLSCTGCSNPTASPTSTTTYTVIGTHSNGCSDTDQVVVSVHPLPTVSTPPDTSICNGDNINLNATGASTYAWTPGTNLSCTNCANPSANPSGTTTYLVTGTDVNGCYDTADITITVLPLPTVGVSPSTTICAGDTTVLQATGAVSYTWSPTTGLSCNNCPNPTATPTSTTTYTVTGTNASGCSDTAMVTIHVNPLPNVNAGADQSLCLGANTQLQATGAATYTWSPATGLSCTGCANPTVNINTTTTYTVTGTDVNGCTKEDQVTITIHPLPSITTSNNQTICEGNAAQLQVSGAQTYIWTPATGLSCTNCANPTASPTTTTTYTVIGTDVNGCKDTAQVTITVNPAPPVNAGPDKSICLYDAVQLQANGAVSFAWTPATGLSCTNCPTPTAAPSTTTTYTVTGTDNNGCTNTDNVTVTVLPLPNVNAGIDKTICKGDTVQLHATGTSNYNWQPGIRLSCTNCASPHAYPVNDITYTVIGTDQNGCTDTDQVNITVILPNPVVIGKGDTLCEGESTQLFASGGDAYTWTPSTGLDNPHIPNPTANPMITTDYAVVIKQGNCFADSGFVKVVVNPLPTVDAGKDQSILAGESIMLFARTTHTTKYLWSPSVSLSCDNCQNPTATPTATTTYTVFVSNNFGCEAEDDVTISIRCDNSLLYMANTFTPNADGANDRFYPQGKGIRVVKKFSIFNRWGELVFEAQNIEANDEFAGWDGSYKGQPLNPDVFVYIVEAECVVGDIIRKKGDISLIR